MRSSRQSAASHDRTVGPLLDMLRPSAHGGCEVRPPSAIEFGAQPLLKPHGPREPGVKVRLTKSAGDHAYGGKSRSFANGPPRRFIG